MSSIFIAIICVGIIILLGTFIWWLARQLLIVINRMEDIEEDLLD